MYSVELAEEEVDRMQVPILLNAISLETGVKAPVIGAREDVKAKEASVVIEWRIILSCYVQGGKFAVTSNKIDQDYLEKCRNHVD